MNDERTHLETTREMATPARPCVSMSRLFQLTSRLGVFRFYAAQATFEDYPDS